MAHAYWNDWYFGWAGFFGSFVFLLFSSLGTGLYLRAHQKFDKPPHKEAFDILDARYAKGEINREVYNQMNLRLPRITRRRRANRPRLRFYEVSDSQGTSVPSTGGAMTHPGMAATATRRRSMKTLLELFAKYQWLKSASGVASHSDLEGASASLCPTTASSPLRTHHGVAVISPKLEAMCFAAVCLGTLATTCCGFWRFASLRSGPGHKVVADRLIPAGSARNRRYWPNCGALWRTRHSPMRPFGRRQYFATHRQPSPFAVERPMCARSWL